MLRITRTVPSANICISVSYSAIQEESNLVLDCDVETQPFLYNTRHHLHHVQKSEVPDFVSLRFGAGSSVKGPVWIDFLRGGGLMDGHSPL